MSLIPHLRVEPTNVVAARIAEPQRAACVLGEHQMLRAGAHVNQRPLLRFRIVNVGLTRAFLERKSDCRRVSRSLLAEGWVVPVAGRGSGPYSALRIHHQAVCGSVGNSYGFRPPVG